jgi:hypothetical protein
LEKVKISIHAAEEALEEEITRSEILDAFSNAEVLEDYPEWWLGPSCLLYGKTKKGRDLHIVSSYGNIPITIVTVYEPKPPTWVTPTQRGVKA